MTKRLPNKKIKTIMINWTFRTQMTARIWTHSNKVSKTQLFVHQYFYVPYRLRPVRQCTRVQHWRQRLGEWLQFRKLKLFQTIITGYGRRAARLKWIAGESLYYVRLVINGPPLIHWLAATSKQISAAPEILHKRIPGRQVCIADAKKWNFVWLRNSQ